MQINLPLMSNNILREDLDKVIELLKGDPILTQSTNVISFEEQWSKWLGVKYSVFVNSGSSANQITMAALKYLYGEGEVIVPTLTWVSDIASVLQNGFTPVFVDINPKNLGMNIDEVIRKITPKTKAIFLTHILGYNALNDKLLQVCKEKSIPLIEDVCESHGATFKGQRLGSFGHVSNFSFYYAHHMSTIEGGMVSTNDANLYQIIRMFRSHGMVRESNDENFRKQFINKYPDLNPQFIFEFPAYNVRSTEINAVMGISQLKRLDENIRIRNENNQLFLKNLDSRKYRTDFDVEGSSNYAFVLILKNGTMEMANKLMHTLDKAKVEYRRGTSGGGNQLRQPYIRRIFGDKYHEKFPEVDYVHFYGFYIGNFPDLEKEKIINLCKLLNSID